MRDEVLAQMELERREGTAVATAGQEAAAEPGSPTTAGTGATTAKGFRFTALGQELVVAGVFVGVYNQQPNFSVADPAAFCRGLVTFIHSRMKPEVYYPSLSADQEGQADKDDSSQSTHGTAAQKGANQSDGAHAVDGNSRLNTPADRQTELLQLADVQSQTPRGVEAQQSDRPGQEQRSRQEVTQALQALINLLQAVPKLTGLMASRPAITPLLNCLEPICR